jgi:hypothetical protein
MDAALALAHKPHQLLLLAGADHTVSMEDDRARMFTALEAFLSANLHLLAPAQGPAVAGNIAHLPSKSALRSDFAATQQSPWQRRQLICQIALL